MMQSKTLSQGVVHQASACALPRSLSLNRRRGLPDRSAASLVPTTTQLSAFLPRQQRPTRQLHQCNSKAKDVAAKNSERQISIPLLGRSVGERTFFYFELLVLLAQLGLVDAAYSGDWSRIGIISTELEAQLQLVVNFIVIAHGSLSVVAFFLAQGKPGRNPAVVAAQTLLFGSMAIYELLHEDASA